MTRETLDKLRSMGMNLGPKYDVLADALTKSRKNDADNAQIINIQVKPDLQNKLDNNPYFIVRVVLSTSDYINLVFVEVDSKVFQASQKSDIFDRNSFYAQVYVDFSIPRIEETFTLTATLKNIVNNQITNTKALDVKVNEDGNVGLTDEKVEVENETDDCQNKFDKISAIILKHEGGYVDDPADKGGKTNKGIAWATWLAYSKIDLNIEPTLENLKKITDNEAKIIYKKRYWEPKGFCIIDNLKIALMFYDWTITSGGARKEFSKFLENEYEISIEMDNNYEENMAKEINKILDQDKLLINLAELRKDYYKKLAYKTNRDNTFKKDEIGKLIKTTNYKFLKGWLIRVDDCLNINL